MKKRRGKRGGSKGKMKQTLRDLSRERPTRAEWDHFLNEFTGVSDRVCALIGGALADNAIRALLLSHFRDSEDAENEMFDGAIAPLHDFAGRIKIAHALDLISPSIRQNFDCVRQIRNAFAHSEKAFGFDHPLVSAECSQLIVRKEKIRDAYCLARCQFMNVVLEDAQDVFTKAMSKQETRALVSAMEAYGRKLSL